jgi:hypothetical protein
MSRRPVSSQPPAGAASALIRGIIELLVSAVEKISRNLSLCEDYEAWAAADAEGDALRLGALRASSPTWRGE